MEAEAEVVSAAEASRPGRMLANSRGRKTVLPQNVVLPAAHELLVIGRFEGGAFRDLAIAPD